MIAEEIEESLKPKCGGCLGIGTRKFLDLAHHWCADCAGTGLHAIDMLPGTDPEYRQLRRRACELFQDGHKPPYPRFEK